MTCQQRTAFRKLLDKWEDTAELEEDEIDEPFNEGYAGGITGCIWALEELLAEQFKDWSND